ncbi:trehalase-like domain-containing protein [Microtetraspora fusca]|uniref:Trehalase-like domain-containing protein n=1 Tax=Microtetraspora fusca TaxID=1997 RepID=A0ABW6UWL7_MICFU
MLNPDPPFRPVRRRDGYLPLEDLGLIGDGATAALVGLDGSIPWLCLPRFDAEPLFCALLDHARGGHFTMTPEELREARQWYEPDTVSTWCCPGDAPTATTGSTPRRCCGEPRTRGVTG